MKRGAMADGRRRMDEVISGLPTKAAKIRALDQSGYSRSEIAKHLGIRYQHVRNVLVRTKPEALPESLWLKVGPGGRIVIPAPYRKAVGVEVGDRIMLRLEEDGELRIISQRVAIKRAQELVRRYFPGEERLSDLLIAQRRAEAAREDQET